MASNDLGAITLRPWEVDDAPALLVLYEANRQELTETEPWRPTDFYSEAGQRRRISEALNRREMMNFLILEADTIVGTIGFEKIDVDTPRSADIGYWIDAAHRRRGVATRAVRMAIEYGFGVLGLTRIRANVEPGNIASQRVLERNAFRLVDRRCKPLAGRSLDLMVFERSGTAIKKSR